MSDPTSPSAFGAESLDETTSTALSELAEADVPRRIGNRDFTVWSHDPDEISNRLGWLSVAHEMRTGLEEIRVFWRDRIAEGVRDVVLVGMGGSSLAPEVFRQTFGSAPGHPRLHVLDSTSPAWIRRVTASVDPARLHLLVASKSGSTIEVRTVAAHFLELLGPHGGAACATAITDPGTGLAQRAEAEGFRHAFLNPPDIGGRFSALSRFGLVPAGALGMDLDRFLDSADVMAARCGPDVPAAENPGARLGAFLGGHARTGRDKLGLLASPSIASFGLWVEQLLAESTGKDAVGILPVTDEPPVATDRLGPDRMFAVLRVEGDDNARLDERARELVDAGFPVFRCDLSDAYDLGAEIYRWEFATAVAGRLLEIHPFDQPDVQLAKSRTQSILETFQRGETPPAPEVGDALEALQELHPGDAAMLMVYGDVDESLQAALRDLRAAIQTRWGVPTTVGVGPRFLHSTGQLHKGGPNRGVFVQLVLDEESLPIPGEGDLDFARLIRAQADGDYGALLERERRVVRMAAGEDPGATVRELADACR